MAAGASREPDSDAVPVKESWVRHRVESVQARLATIRGRPGRARPSAA